MRPLVVIFVSLSLILCLLSLTTDYWYEKIEDHFNSGLFVKCSRSAAPMASKICYRLSYTHSRGLAICGLIFLSISFLILILSWFKCKSRSIAYLNVLFLLISSVLLLFSYISYPKEKVDYQIGHSTYLMLVSALLAFLSTILTIFIAQSIQ